MYNMYYKITSQYCPFVEQKNPVYQHRIFNQTLLSMINFFIKLQLHFLLDYFIQLDQMINCL